MTNYYLDSSTLVKRYMLEPGAGWVRSLFDASAGNSISISRITQAEIISAVSR